MTKEDQKCTTRIAGVLVALGYNHKTLAKDLNITPYKAKCLLDAKRRVEYEELIQILSILRRMPSDLLIHGRDSLDDN